MLLPLRYPKVWLALGWLFVLLALIAGLLPSGIPSGIEFNDKLMHALGYFALTTWFTGIYPRSRYVAVAMSLLAMGVGVEIAQDLMHAGRTAELPDVYANAVGVGVGLALALLALGGWVLRVESWIARR